MIQRINRYLLTHHPLLWNTRALWVLGINVLLHLLFFVAGFFSVRPDGLGDERSPWSVGGEGLVVFSVFCTLLVLILWLLFYFRNNAFRNGYRLGPGYLLREWGLLVLISFSSFVYYESYLLGLRLRVRQYTNTERFVQEVNAANLAIAFVPESETELTPYFVLNSCAEGGRIGYDRGTDYRAQAEQFRTDTSQEGRRSYQEALTVLRALEQPDAFSYRHYCMLPFNYSWSYGGTASAEELGARRARWIANGERDSIRASLETLLSICRRYGVKPKVNVDELTNAVFAKPGNTLEHFTPDEPYYYNNDVRQEHPSYLQRSDLYGAFSFVDDCLPNRRNRQHNGERLLAEGYAAFALALLLWAWRRFSRKVFLVSIVGVLVWSIVVGLLSIGTESGTRPTVIILLLFALFGIVGWALLKERTNKTAAGALLLWHYFLAAGIIPLLLFLVDNHLDHQRWDMPHEDRDRMLQESFPVLYWINGHAGLFFGINFLLMIGYIGFSGNRAARRWQPMPEE